MKARADAASQTIAQAEPASPADRPFWSRGWFWLALMVISTAPFVFAVHPMMPDLFSHTGRYYVMDHRAASPFLSRYYSFDWHLIGNLGVDLLMVPLGKLLPTELAVRLAVGSIPPLTIAGIYAVAKAAWGRIDAPALLALPFVYAFSFVYGFVNYHLALALALLVFALWIRTQGLPLLARWLLFAPLAVVVWAAHVAGWGALLVMAGAWQLASALERRDALLQALVHAALQMVPLLVPLVFIVAWRAADAGMSNLFGYDLPAKLVWPFTLLKGENKIFDVASVAVLGLVAVWLVASRRVRKHPGLLAAAAALAAAYLVMPFMLFDSAFADARILPALAIVLFVGLGTLHRRDAQVVAMIALALFSVRLAATTVGWHVRAAEAERDLQALDQVPRGARIAAFALQSYCGPWQMSAFEHLPSLAIVRREAFVNTQWDTPGAQLMHPIYNQGRGFNDSRSVSLGGGRKNCAGPAIGEVLRQLPRDRFDYVWVFDQPELRSSWLRRAYQGPHASLYAIVR